MAYIMRLNKLIEKKLKVTTKPVFKKKQNNVEH
jgi:hypothetical protein